MSKVYADIDYKTPSWTSSGRGDDYPAYYINWYDALLYCNARTKFAGRTDTVYKYTSITGTPGNDCTLEDLVIDSSQSGYCLPTDAQWEFACRAGTSTPYYFDSASIDNYAWYEDNIGTATRPQLVAQKLPNSYGLYDMSGNVSEMCENDYSTSHDYYVVERGGSIRI